MVSYPMGTKVRLTESWRAYRVGDTLEQGFEVDLESQIVSRGIGVKVDANEAETPGRPAKFARKAAEKLAAGIDKAAAGTKGLFGGSSL